MTDGVRNTLRMNDLGLLVVRGALGLAMAAHGAQKLFGWFGGFGLEGTAGFFETLGFQPGIVFAAAAGTGELVGGLLIALGLLGVVGPAIVVGVMLVAIVSVHLPNGFFAASNGYELPLIYGVVAVTLALVGFGRYALDQKLNLALLRRPVAVAGAMSATILGAVASVMIR